MSRYEAVYKSICRDPDFRALSVDGKWLYVWSFINEACHLSGLYEMSAEQMAFDSTLAGKRLERALGELHGRKMTHFAENVVWVRAKIKRNPTRGAKIAQPIFREVSEIDPRHPLRIALLYHYCVELPKRGEDFEWLRPLLETLNVVPHSAGDKLAEYDSSDESSRPRDGTIELVELVVSPSSSSEEQQELLAEFDDWLEHHQALTGRVPPKAKTVARSQVFEAFRARRSEDYSLDDLKSATHGAFNDAHRREHGYFGCESILRPTKVHDLVEKGRMGNVTPLNRKLQNLEAMRRWVSDEDGDDAA